LADGKARVKSIQAFHQGPDRKWSDIGYHFLIDSVGDVFQGRAFYDDATGQEDTLSTLEDHPHFVLGAHVGGHNTGNIGVCMLGCFDPLSTTTARPCDDTLTRKSKAALARLIAYLSVNYNISSSKIRGHRDWRSTTTCPGQTIYEQLPRLREDIGNMTERDCAVPEPVQHLVPPKITISWRISAVGLVALTVLTLLVSFALRTLHSDHPQQSTP